MRFPILLASAAALSLAACNNTSAPPPQQQGSGQPGALANVSENDLETQVMQALADAPKNGLTKDLFLKGPLPSAPGERRAVLIKAVEDYASALANGRVDPSKIWPVYTVPRAKIDVSAGLSQALQQKKLKQWLATLPPQTDEYRALSKAFVQIVQTSPKLPDASIPGGGAIKPGSHDSRIPAIAQYLQELGYLPPAPAAAQPPAGEQQPAANTRYTPVLVAAMKKFQADSGQKPDGVIGPATIGALNKGPRDRARTLAVAMERLRWLNRAPPATRIDVNTAAAILDYWRDGQHKDERKVVVGEPGWETPQLGAPMFQLVANPTWTVPDSIVKQEIASKSSGWLSSHDFTQKNGHWVQGSGPKNSLGIVKFDLKDDQAIYLHDTPAKSLFSLPDRHRSHGCIRVQDAIGFAHEIATDEGIDDQFSKAMATGNETFVPLKQSIPVRLLYHTAYLGDDGKIHIVADVYGWDDDVATALGYAHMPFKAQVPNHGDIGP